MRNKLVQFVLDSTLIKARVESLHRNGTATIEPVSGDYMGMSLRLPAVALTLCSFPEVERALERWRTKVQIAACPINVACTCVQRFHPNASFHRTVKLGQRVKARDHGLGLAVHGPWSAVGFRRNGVLCDVYVLLTL